VVPGVDLERAMDAVDVVELGGDGAELLRADARDERLAARAEAHPIGTDRGRRRAADHRREAAPVALEESPRLATGAPSHTWMRAPRR